MNEEEKKAIARVERLYKFSQDVNHTAIVLTEDTRCLGIVLNLLQQEKEKNKKLEEVIDMLIEDIVEYHIPADFCMQYGKYKENCKTLDDNQMCKKCIRDYYYKKARGEE